VAPRSTDDRKRGSRTDRAKDDDSDKLPSNRKHVDIPSTKTVECTPPVSAASR
jgi:hypothetical protein